MMKLKLANIIALHVSADIFKVNELDLMWHLKKLCPLCNIEEESIYHFIIECYILQKIRN